MPRNTCKECVFFQASEGAHDGKGLCHANPPQAIIMPPQYPIFWQYLRPVVEEWDLACRHFQPNEVEND